METTKGGNKGAMIPIAPARGGTWRLDMHKASSFWGIFCCTISGHCIDVGESMGNKREKRIKFSVPVIA